MGWRLGAESEWLRRVIYGVKAFLPLIKQTGEGHIINTASTAGLQATGAIGPYNVAKFGVVALTETLRVELEDVESVSASVLCPGAINTQIVTSKRNRDPNSAKDHQSSKEEQAFEEGAGQLLAKLGKDPAEVADLVCNAITNNDFWILTHPEWKDVLSDRVEAMKKDNSLHRGFGG